MIQIQTPLDELRASGKLPSPNGTALKVMQLVQSIDASIADVTKVLKSDPAMSGRVLRIINSADAGFAQPIADLTHAVSLLGLRTVRKLVLGFSILDNSPRGSKGGFDFDRFWRISLARALACQTTAKALDNFDAEEAYCFGLLSRIGQLGLATVHAERYGQLTTEYSDESALLQAEQKTFGINHHQLTAALLEDWRLPSVIIDAVRCDTDELPIDSAPAKLATMLDFATALVAVWFSEEGKREQCMCELQVAAQQLELPPETLTRVADNAMGDWEEWCSLLDLDSATLVPLETAMAECGNTDSASVAAPENACRILVVDDDPQSLRFTRHQLLKVGYKIATAESAHDALRVLLDFKPQIVITDWVMPEMDGLQLCRTIRGTEIGQQIYVIMVTSHDDKSRLAEAFAAGCDDYLTKPIHPQELGARTRAAFRVVQLQAELRRESEKARQYAAELSLGNQELQREAGTDPLTGLPNPRFAEE